MINLFVRNMKYLHDNYSGWPLPRGISSSDLYSMHNLAYNGVELNPPYESGPPNSSLPLYVEYPLE